jgi:hypothetical protein
LGKNEEIPDNKWLRIPYGSEDIKIKNVRNFVLLPFCTETAGVKMPYGFIKTENVRKPAG